MGSCAYDPGVRARRGLSSRQLATHPLVARTTAGSSSVGGTSCAIDAQLLFVANAA
jgi:hypothetical protein